MSSNPIQLSYSTGTRVYGNDFGIYSDGVTPAPYSTYRAMSVLYSSTDTEIGDGSVGGSNVFGGGMGGVEFVSFGSFVHNDVRVKGNKLGVDLTGTLKII